MDAQRLMRQRRRGLGTVNSTSNSATMIKLRPNNRWIYVSGRSPKFSRSNRRGSPPPPVPTRRTDSRITHTKALFELFFNEGVRGLLITQTNVNGRRKNGPLWTNCDHSSMRALFGTMIRMAKFPAERL